MSWRKRSDEMADDIVTQTGYAIQPKQGDGNPTKQSCLSDPSRNQINFLQTMSRIFRQQSQLMTQHAQVLDSLWNPSAAVQTAETAPEEELHPDSTNHLAIHTIHTTNPFETTDLSDIIITDSSRGNETKALSTSFVRKSTAKSSKTLVNSSSSQTNSLRGISNNNGDARKERKERQTSPLAGKQNESIRLSPSTALVVSRTSTTVPDSTSTRKIRDLTKQLKTVQSSEKEKIDSSRKRKAR